MINPTTNLQHAREAATALLKWRLYLQENIDVTRKEETTVLTRVVSALIDVEEAAKTKLPDMTDLLKR